MSDSVTICTAHEDPLFVMKEAPVLREEDIIDLACGAIGVLRVPGFLDRSTRMAVMSSLPRDQFISYSAERYRIAALRIGPVINEFKRNNMLDEEYWTRASAASSVCARSGVAIVRNLCLSQLASAWPRVVSPATVMGRPLYWGIVREVNEGSLLHWDDVIREFPHGLLDSRPVAQLSLNVFIETSPQGGETRIWKRRWTPADELHRYAFGYKNGFVDSSPALISVPESGDAIFFDPRNYHQVQPCQGGRRVALASFLGVSADGTLTIWS